MESTDKDGHVDDLPLFPTSHRLAHHANDYAQDAQDDGLQERKGKEQRFTENDAMTDEEYRVLLHNLALEESKKRSPLRYGLLTLSNPEPTSQLSPVPARHPWSPSPPNPEQPSTSGYTEENARRASERFEEEMFQAIEESKNRKRKRTGK
ncbi:hypothetical protein CRE_31219 [Caenorhabditis remanei]|uniref:Uncharacterized protein n=1 Tax=Caenorhabditis remanei TaxID=31234 RepID=E3MLM9_CAERE|nr:hypothetical protein CRE_31219 [Caenorhabditis remanei]